MYVYCVKKKLSNLSSITTVGPKLPSPMQEFSLITSPTRDSLFAIFHTTIYQTSGDSWTVLEQKLEIPRDDYVAMFVPDELVSCRKRNL